jgi:glucose-6-phosphate isomerase
VPGVEAGKKAAASVLALQGNVLAALSAVPQTADELAARAGAGDQAETVYLLLEHLAANGRARAARAGGPGQPGTGGTGRRSRPNGVLQTLTKRNVRVATVGD